MGPTGRIRIIVASLIVLGATLGAAAAALSIALIMAVVERSAPGWIAIVFAAGLGAVLGAVFGPSTMWTILRHVPLGRAMGVTFVGTVVGALAGSLLLMPHVGAVVGFFVAASSLSDRHGKVVGTAPGRDAV